MRPAYSLEGCGVSWLRLDDGFARHPKVLELSEVQRWRWVELLLDCARLGRRGDVSAAMLRKVGLSASRLLELGLLDADGKGSGYRVHDWEDYNDATNAQALRQKRYRMRRAGVDEGEIMRVAPPLPGPERYVTRDVTRDVAVTRTEESDPAWARVPRNPTKDGTAAKDGSDSDAPSSRSHDVDELLARLSLDETRADYVWSAASRVPPAVVAGLLATLDAHSADPAGYVLESLRRALA
jgi:hypothetical protein